MRPRWKLNLWSKGKAEGIETQTIRVIQLQGCLKAWQV